MAAESSVPPEAMPESVAVAAPAPTRLSKSENRHPISQAAISPPLVDRLNKLVHPHQSLISAGYGVTER